MPSAPDSNYTKVPNDLLDLITSGDMGYAEMKVTLAILRETNGWHKDEVELSYGRFESLTGLTRTSVADGIKAGMERGTIQRAPTQQGYAYSLAETEHSSHITSRKKLLVGKVDQSSKATSTSLVKLPVLVGQGYQYKEERKNLKKDKESIAEVPESAPPAPTKKTRKPKPTQEQIPDPVREVLFEVCGIDSALCTHPQRMQVYQSVKLIRSSAAKQNQPDEEIITTIRYVASWFAANDWRGKQGQKPTPANLREVWRQAIEDRIRQQTRASPYVAPRPPPAPDERPYLTREEQKQRATEILQRMYPNGQYAPQTDIGGTTTEHGG